MIDPMFFVPIFHIKTKDWYEKKNILLSLINEDKLVAPEDSYAIESVTTDFHTRNNRYVNLVSNTISSELMYFSQSINRDVSICDYWFERANTGEHHPVHNHGVGTYSAVLYLQYDKEVHRPIVFIAPFNNFIDGTTLYYRPQDVEEASLIIFPSVINHFTYPNKSNKPRTVLSFNLNIHE